MVGVRRSIATAAMVGLLVGCAPIAPPAPAESLGGTSWQLVRFQGGDGAVLTPDDRAKYTVAFASDGAVSVRFDCNRGRGTWTSPGPQQLQLGPLALTRALCPPGSLHDHLVKQWPFIRSFVLKGGSLFLLLMADGGAYELEPLRVSGGVACGGIQIVSDELTTREAEAYCRYAIEERKKVDAFWGATWTDPIRIHVSSKYRISRALVPGYLGDRGFMEMPLRRVRDSSGALLHEIVHVYAPNANRFLAEGLAVYLHAKLAGNPGPPNFGENLRRAAGRSLGALRSLEALNAVQTPRPLGTVMDELTAYVLAGSFVEFLVETQGVPLFRSLYDTADYQKVYGKSLVALESDWRANLSR
jgi:heat shock protein HslJ